MTLTQKTPSRLLSTGRRFSRYCSGVMKNDLQPSAVIEGVEVFPILGYEGRYSVSKCGRVWSHDREVPDSRGWVRRIQGKWTKLVQEGSGYLKVTLSKNNVSERCRIHRLVALAFFELEGLQVDHINGDRADNRVENLRAATRRQNAYNRGADRVSTSRFKGVSWNREKRKWEVKLRIDGRNRTLGRYDTEEDAAVAYDRRACEIHGEFFRPNLP